MQSISFALNQSRYPNQAAKYRAKDANDTVPRPLIRFEGLDAQNENFLAILTSKNGAAPFSYSALSSLESSSNGSTAIVEHGINVPPGDYSYELRHMQITFKQMPQSLLGNISIGKDRLPIKKTLQWRDFEIELPTTNESDRVDSKLCVPGKNEDDMVDEADDLASNTGSSLRSICST